MKQGFSILLKLRRREGISLMALIAVMVIMAVTGSIFGTFMGRWKVSAPMEINSLKAFCLAETALMFALEDAKYRFFGGSFNRGTRSSPRSLVSSSTYWFELPSPNAFGASASDDKTSGSEDDDVDDDNDDSTANLYTIIATGKVKRGSTAVATRQIKVKATIVNDTSKSVLPGIYTDGDIRGTGGSGFNMFKDDGDSVRDVEFGNTVYDDSSDPPESGSRDGIVYQAPAYSAPVLDVNIIKALATDQGHYQIGGFTPANNYPNGSFYYSGTVPNITYVNGDMDVIGSRAIYGIFWVTGAVTVSGNAEVYGIIIGNSDITMNGGGGSDIELFGGIIQYGSTSRLTGNGSPVDIKINNAYFSAIDSIWARVTVNSWQEAVSAN
ncbi:MAG TPA: hypothetical protein ACFYD1_03055 [Candidatus Hypogeohydataceae bacterium YC38]